MAIDTLIERHLKIWEEMFKVAQVIDEIKQKNPDCIKFVIDENTVRSIYFYIQSGNFDTLMYMFGHPFLIQLLHHYEQKEDFEICQKIIERISYYNELTNSNLSLK